MNDYDEYIKMYWEGEISGQELLDLIYLSKTLFNLEKNV